MKENNANSRKVALVTGSSSGTGLETSLTLAENKFRTYATMRNIDKAANVLELAKKRNVVLEIVKLDVNDDYSVHRAIQQIVEKEKTIDLLVYNAGYTQLGAIEDLSLNEIQAQYNTNVFGIFRLIKEVAPVMRSQRTGGTIINIGSANGFFGVPCASVYVSTKFALEGLTQSLRLELAHFGLRVVIIEPGAIKTNVAKQHVSSQKVKRTTRPQPSSLGSCSFPKYLSGRSSGIRTSNKRNQLEGKCMNENIIATEYVIVVATIRLPALLPIKAGTVLSINSGFRFA
jgi:NAD(P)-dependent dehydrogenase (short-subunit alcohol dehydrogenase family)